jgi:FkbM family methyltransferase
LIKRILVLLFTSQGRFRLRLKVFRWIALRKLQKDELNHFTYKRPDQTSFVYLKDNAFSNTIYSCKPFELTELRWCAAWLSEGGTFIDGGANIGLYSTYMATRCPQTKIHAIECFPKTFKDLEFIVRTLGLSSKIELHHAALSERDGLWIENDCPPGLEECNQIRIVSAPNELTIQTITLSQILLKCDVAPYLIKLDLEGHEFPAMKGMEIYFGQSPKCFPAILIEISDKSNQSDLRNWFSEHHYDLYFADGFGQGPSFGTRVELIKNLPPVSNLMAIHSDDDSRKRFEKTLELMKS